MITPTTITYFEVFFFYQTSFIIFQQNKIFRNIAYSWLIIVILEEYWLIYTVQTFNSCTSQPDVCQCLVKQTHKDNTSKNKPSIWITHIAYISKLRLVVRSSMPMGGNRGCGWVLCRAAQAFSAGILCRHCTFVVLFMSTIRKSLTQQHGAVVQQVTKMVEHGLLILARCAAEIAKEATTHDDHVRGRAVLLGLLLGLIEGVDHQLHDRLVDV